MDVFYANITLRGPEQLETAAHLNRRERLAFVSPEVNGHVVVYEKRMEDQDIGDMSELASELSSHFSCPALAVLVHDDAMLWYGLHDRGELMDQYNSTPGYFVPGKRELRSTGGNSEALCQAFAPEADRRAIHEVLQAPALQRGRYKPASERHAALVEALAAPRFSVGVGYMAISAGLLPVGLAPGSLMHSAFLRPPAYEPPVSMKVVTRALPVGAGLAVPGHQLTRRLAL